MNPAKLHMTVPVAFRRRAKAPNILVLHRARLNEKDVEQRQGFAVKLSGSFDFRFMPSMLGNREEIASFFFLHYEELVGAVRFELTTF